mmetsp:Transcript_71778/g.207885  ORF Transcript_71778/g.207885 Transcript_71778/m.207885 type:complete len:349 (+) Transcript_71778:606-1652(+)
MDPLNDQHAVLGHRVDLVPGSFAVARRHVVDGRHHRLAGAQGPQVLADQVDVHGLNVVVVDVASVLPDLILRLPIQGEVVVVHRERLGHETQIRKVHAQLVREGCLPGRGWPRDADHLHLATLVAPPLHCRCDIGQLLLLPKLALQHKVLPPASGLLQGIQRAHAGHAVGLAENYVVLMRIHQRRLRHIPLLCIGGHEARRVRDQVEATDLQRPQGAVQVMGRHAQGAEALVALHLRGHPRGNERPGALEALGFEVADHLMPWLLDLQDRAAGLDELLKLRLDQGNLRCGEGFVHEPVVVALADGVASAQWPAEVRELRRDGDAKPQRPAIHRIDAGGDLRHRLRPRP